MNTQMKDDVIAHKYRVASIEKTTPPEGMPDGDWYHYIVEYGKSTIDCIRAGSLKDVTQHAQDFVENLNTRTAKGYSSYAARKPKK